MIITEPKGHFWTPEQGMNRIAIIGKTSIDIHWTKSEMFDCIGDGCPFCERSTFLHEIGDPDWRGFQPIHKNWYDIVTVWPTWEKRAVWLAGIGVGDEIAALAQRPPFELNSFDLRSWFEQPYPVFEVTRTGQGLTTQYTVDRSVQQLAVFRNERMDNIRKIIEFSTPMKLIPSTLETLREACAPVILTELQEVGM